MAEIIESSLSKKGRRKNKKLNTKVDLTPMVDLGFLLITFFIFTTSMARPVSMKLNMPDDTEVTDSMQASSDRTITFVVSSNDELFFYPGIFNGQFTRINYKALRDIIREKKQQVYSRFGNNHITVLIKTTKEGNYGNVIDCLDEMVINGVSTYMLLEPTEAELNALNN